MKFLTLIMACFLSVTLPAFAENQHLHLQKQYRRSVSDSGRGSRLPGATHHSVKERENSFCVKTNSIRDQLPDRERALSNQRQRIKAPFESRQRLERAVGTRALTYF